MLAQILPEGRPGNTIYRDGQGPGEGSEKRAQPSLKQARMQTFIVLLVLALPQIILLNRILLSLFWSIGSI